MAVPKNQVMREFSIMGSNFVSGASALINRLRGRVRLELRREPSNPADQNAVMVLWGSRQLGWLPRGLAADIAPLMDSGVKVIAQKAPTALYGVCQIAWIQPPEPVPAVDPSDMTPTRLVDLPEEQKDKINDEQDPDALGQA